MDHDHITTCPVADLGDASRPRGTRGTHAAYDPTDTPSPLLILSLDS